MPENLGQPIIGLPGENVPQPEQVEPEIIEPEQPQEQPIQDDTLDTQALITQLEEDKARAEALPAEIQESFKDAPPGMVDPLGLGAGEETVRAEILAIDANTAGAKIELLKNYEVAQAQIKDAESKAGDPAYQVNQEQIDFAKENLGKLREYLKVINNPKWTPFIQYNGSNFVIPIDKFEMVEKLGITDKELVTLGYDQNDLDKMREKRKVLDILNKYDNLSDAVRDGKIDVVRKANALGMITDKQLLDAQIGSAEIGSSEYKQIMAKFANEKLKGFINDSGQLKLTEAIKAGIDYKTINEAGYEVSKSEYESIRSRLGIQITGGFEVTDIEDYKSGSGYDLSKYLRDNPNQQEYLRSIGFSQESINKATEYNNLPYIRPTAQDNINKALVSVGLRLDGNNTPDEIDQILKDHPEILEMPTSEPQLNLEPDISFEGFVSEFVNVRKDLPEYQSINNSEARLALLKNMASREYMRLYGKGTALASQGTDILEFVAPASRALHEEYDVKDITGVEWAITGANIALLVVSPVLGKIGGGIARGFAKTTELISSTVYPAVTVYEWKNMSVGERIINVALDATIIGAIAGKSVVNGIKNINPGIGFSRRVDDIAKAVQSGSTTKVWASGSKLEKYGEALERSGIQTGTRIKEYGSFVKNNAETIAKNYRPDLPSSYNNLISELENIDKAMFEYRQKGSLSIDPRTGKIIDTETGLEATPQRQIEKLRDRTRISTIERLTENERQSFKREFNLSDDELDELVNITGGDRQAMRELARKRLFKKMNDDLFDRLNKESELKEEQALAQSEEESIIAESAKQEESIRSVTQQSYITIQEQDAINKQLAEEVANAAKQVERERIYKYVFPDTKTDSETYTAFVSKPIAVKQEQEISRPFTKPQTISISDIELQELAKQKIVSKPIQLTEVETQQQTQLIPETLTKQITETMAETETKTDLQTDIMTNVVTDTKTETINKTATNVGQETFTSTELKKEEKRRPDINISLGFEDSPAIAEKLKNGFITWRQGKTYWAIPQLIDGTFDSEDKVASGKPFKGTTKFAVGKGSVYKTFQYVGKNPPEKTAIDVGFAQFSVVRENGDVKITKINPDDTANWEGVNKYTTPEAIAEKQLREREAKDLRRLANIERYKRQYLKQKPRKQVKEPDVFAQAEKELVRKNEPVEIPVNDNKRRYLGFEILSSDIGGKL